MRVLHVAAGNLYGGIERILVEIAARPDAAARHDFALCFDGRLWRELCARGAVVHALGGVRFSRPWSVWRARQRLRSLAHGVDRIVCHSSWPYALAAPALGERHPVLWAHDASDGRHWTERRVAERPPSMAICNSAFTAAALRGWLPGTPCHVVYAPLVAAAPDPGVRAQVRRALGASEGATVFIVASRYERWKGHIELLRALAGVQGDWVLWVAGGPQRSAERQYAREIRGAITELAIAHRVRLLGARDDVQDLLRGADVHVQPNTAPEPFGLAFVEALGAGLPVIATAAGGPVEIVTPDCGVLVPAADPAALRAALQRMVSDPAFRRRLASRGPARAAELCDPATQIRRMDAVLASALGAVAS